MTQKIKFINTSGYDELEQPEPASKFIPDWYKGINSYITGDKVPSGSGQTTGTIKRCMPVFDAITAGYIIKLPADVYISRMQLPDGTTQPFYEWANFDLVNFHPIEQAPNHPQNTGHVESYPKWTNLWGVKTPKGYSTLFVQPFHRESVFTILPGIVDTDKYFSQVNFPFVLNDINFEGLIPAGTPIAQVIPIKRDDWEMEFGNEKDMRDLVQVDLKLRIKFFDRYKETFRQIKSYK